MNYLQYDWEYAEEFTRHLFLYNSFLSSFWSFSTVTLYICVYPMYIVLVSSSTIYWRWRRSFRVRVRSEIDSPDKSREHSVVPYTADGDFTGKWRPRDRKTFPDENLPRISNTQKITNKSRIDGGYPSLILLAATVAAGRNYWRPWHFRDGGKEKKNNIHMYIYMYKMINTVEHLNRWPPVFRESRKIDRPCSPPGGEMKNTRLSAKSCEMCCDRFINVPEFQKNLRPNLIVLDAGKLWFIKPKNKLYAQRWLKTRGIHYVCRPKFNAIVHARLSLIWKYFRC